MLGMKKSKKMLFKALLVILLLLISRFPFVCTGYSSTLGNNEVTFERVYIFYTQVGTLHVAHIIHVSVQPSLYYFYRGISHSVLNLNSYCRFVTPEAVRPVAECIRKVVGENNESFINAVLTLIQQMSYTISDVKYPVETLVDGCGDCDVFSVLAASIMKAGGLDVVLFYYKDLNPAHMNVGVYLNSTPSHNWWEKPTCFEYQGKNYWVAECTPQRHWRIGEQPEIVANIKPTIIPLDNYELKSPAKVSASLNKPLKASSISASIKHLNNESCFTLFGSISPRLAGQPITIYTSKNEKSWSFLGETLTDNFGNYFFKLTANLTGLNHFKASWSGASGYAGSDSTTITLLIGMGKSKNAPLKELGIPNDPVLRAQLYAILSLYQLLNRSAETCFFKTLDLEAPTIFSGEFAVLKKGDLNYTFGFVLSEANANYSVNVQGTEGGNIFQIERQAGETKTVLIKAPINLKENSWYKIEVNVSNEYLTAKLYEDSGPLKGIGVKWQNPNITKFEVFMKCGNSTLALKNLTSQTMKGSIQTAGNVNVLSTYSWLIYLLVFSALTISITSILKYNAYRSYRSSMRTSYIDRKSHMDYF
jgi:hypothetical protein